MFSLRILTTSHYQALPIPGIDATHSEFRDTPVKRVPVLRIFGSTPAGQKTCMHVHGVFPYLYVPYDGTQPSDRYLRQFAVSLDKALNVANRSASSTLQHVYKISLVSGIPMYGYHPQEEQFLKIYLYNPNNVRKAADLLLGGAVMNKPFQPHESHIPYPLQLFIDYNLYGMNLITVGALKFRKPIKADAGRKRKSNRADVTSGYGESTQALNVSSTSLSSTLSNRVWHEENIPKDSWLPENIIRQSTCELEVDVVAADIDNRQELLNNVGTNPGLAALWEDERQRRRNAGESSQVEPENSQGRVNVIASDSEKELVQRFLHIVDQQQRFRDSENDESMSTQLSLSASQLEPHISLEDSVVSSQSTTILEESVLDDVSDENSQDNERPIINFESIQKVVSCSQSFSFRSSSQGTQHGSQDCRVTDILAALMEESGPTPSQLASLEDQDSILNQSILLNAEDEIADDEETVLMSQVFRKEDELEHNQNGLKYNTTGLNDPIIPTDDLDIVMNSDDESSDEEVDLLPQFDGASDKVPSSRKKSNVTQNQPQDSTVGTNAATGPNDLEVSHSPSGSDVGSSLEPPWNSGSTNRGMVNPQNYPTGSGPWTQPGWSQQIGTWHSQNTGWSQTQQFQNWQQQQMSPAAYSQQQVTFPSTSTYQSPTHNMYPSTPQPSFQTSSPSQYQFPPYQSPPTNPQYQQSYQSPYNSPTSNQTYQSPQPYQSPSSSQPYQSPSSSQPYQSPSSSHSYQSPPVMGSQPQYSVSAASKTYQSPGSAQPYQSPTASQQYQSPSHPYQSPNSQVYSPSYQPGPHSSPQQPYPPQYQSPGHGYPGQSNWGSQGYPGYYQGQIGTHSSSGNAVKLPTGPVQSQFNQTNTAYGQHGNTLTSTPITSNSPCFQGSTNTLSAQVQSAAELSSQSQTEPKPIVTEPDTSPPVCTESSVVQLSETQALVKRNLPADSKCGGFKSPQPPSTSPHLPKSHFDFNKQMTPSGICPSSPNVCGSPSTSGSGSSQLKLLDQNMASPACSTGENKPTLKLSNKPSETAPSTKISTLDFKPTVAFDSGMCAIKDIISAKSSDASKITKPAGAFTEKVELSSSTPMIQQLLMEESPARMNIKKEDRDAVMKKPMLSPTPPKPKKKYKSKTTQASKTPGRPRSTSLSSPQPTVTGYGGGFNPNPLMNSQMMPRPGRSHSISLPFNSDPRMPVTMSSYGWPQQPQPQWKQQNYQPWQQQQQQWSGNQWPNYNSPSGGNSGDMLANSGSMTNRLQHRSFSADAAQSPYYQNNLQQNQMTPILDEQSSVQGSTTPQMPISGGQVPISSGNSEKPSLSSLFQLVSDVGSGTEDTVWESQTSALPSLFLNSNESDTPKSTSTSELNRTSPSVKDFITLEAPFKQGFERTNSETAGMTSSEESDRMESDFISDLKPNTLSVAQSVRNNHPCLGKQSRLKRLGIVSRSSELGSFELGPNPSYTYTFHVPTPVFKKLKFYRGAEARKHNFIVVRMHPMDARRYSLLKIGREIVKVVKLTEAELARYNVALPPPSYFISSDGSTNRVNLDIPTVSSDKRSGDSGSEESSLSKFDTDFPPNKVAPPSSFHASQVSASIARANSSRSSPGTADRVRHGSAQQQQPNFNGGFSPGRQQRGFSPQHGNYPYSQPVGDRSFGNAFPSHQPLSSGSITRHFGSQPPDCNPGLGFQQFSQKGSNPQSHSTSIHAHGNFYPNQEYLSRTVYPPQQQQYYQQQQQFSQQQFQQSQQSQQQQHTFQQQQPQEGYNGSHPESKNELRSPGQHGLASRIDSRDVHGHSGNEDSQDDKDTTGTSTVNTRVNARRWDSHAEHSASNTDLCRNSQEASLCQTPDNISYCNESEILNLDQGNDLITNLANSKNHKTRKRKGRRKLSLKKSKMPVTKVNNEKCSEVIEDCYGDTKDVTHKSALDNNGDDSIPQLTQVKNPYSYPLPTQRGRRRGKMSWRKNIKALRLNIPESTTNNSLCSLNDNKGIINNHKMLDEERKDTNGVVLSPRLRRSSSSTVKSSDTGAMGIHAARQAKLRSVYSKNPDNGQKLHKKKREPLKEGIHYIVVGKFKGHHVMLVKLSRVSVSPTESVKAQDFESSASKEVVRTASLSMTPHTMYDQMPSVNLNSIHIEKIVNTKSPNIRKSKLSQRYNKRQFQLYGKFRSAEVSVRKQEDMCQESASTEINIKHLPKNAFAGPISGASKNLSQSNVSKDNFFCKFKESFIRHSRAKEPSNESDVVSPHTLFFVGIRNSCFNSFQRKLTDNLKKLKTDDYSSSSDDEDDFLDEMIFKKKIAFPEIFHAYSLKIPPEEVKHPNTLCSNWPKEAVALSISELPEIKEKPKISHSQGLENLKLEGANVQTEDSISTAFAYEHIMKKSGAENMEIESNTVDKTPDQNKHFDKLMTETLPALNGRDKEEEKDDFLKRQMAFFEDISSESDSGDTIIMESLDYKENVTAGNTLGYSPVPTLSSEYNLDKPSDCTASINVPSLEPRLTPDHLQEHKPGFEESPLLSSILTGNAANNHYINPLLKPDSEGSEKDKIVLTKHVKEHSSRDHSMSALPQSSSSLDDGSHDHSMSTLPQSSSSLDDGSHDHSVMSALPQSSSSLDDGSRDQSVMLALPQSSSSLDDVSLKASKPETSPIALEPVISTEFVDEVENNKEEKGLSECKQFTVTNICEKDKLIISIKSCDKWGLQANLGIGHRQKKQSKDMKKSERDKGKKLANSSKVNEDAVSSSNEDRSNSGETGGASQSKCLRQKKQIKYTFYSEDIDTSDGNSSCYSDEDFSFQKARSSKTKRRQKAGELKSKKAPSLDELKSSKSVPKFRASRGRKKKSGGGKLLSSLSLLHMATLANLTEAQTDSLDAQSMSESATAAESEDIGSQYASRAANDHSGEYAPSLETMSFISPQTSSEVEVSPPVPFSPSDKKRGKVTDVNRAGSSRRMLNFARRRASLKPGCNGASNLGSRPLPFSRLVSTSTSSSPVPSNFTFSHTPDSSQQAEPPAPMEDASTANTLQLLETRRAQVNCASFSMKDILRLATPDDSMDSDSKDSFPLVKPPEAKRAQVKSTTLSMSDILKLTSSEMTGEKDTAEASHSLLSKVATPKSQSPLHTKVSNLSKLESIEPQPSPEITEASTSLLSQLATFGTSHFSEHACYQQPNLCNLNSKQEITNASASLLSQISNFQEIALESKLASQTLSSSHTVEDNHSPLINQCLIDSETQNEAKVLQKSKERNSKEKNTSAANEDLEKNQADDEKQTHWKTHVLGTQPNEIGSKRDYLDISSDDSYALQNNSKVTRKSKPCGLISSSNKSPSSSDSLVTDESSHLSRSPKLAETQSSPQSQNIASKLLNKTFKLELQQEPNITNSQFIIPQSPATSSALEIPRISITYDEASVNEILEDASSELVSNLSPKRSHREHTLNGRNVDVDIKPLNPLQIPPYPFIGHRSRTDSNQGYINPVFPYNYPFGWQWSATHNSSATSTPLNLCTTHKSPNSYSPITPTSPVSPVFPPLSQTSSTGMSPPIKKSKPLWYPWLTVDSVKMQDGSAGLREDMKQIDANMTESRKNSMSLNKLNIEGKTTPTQAAITGEQNYSPFNVTRNQSDMSKLLNQTVHSLSERESDKFGLWKEDLGRGLLDKQKVSAHGIKDLLSSPPKTNAFKVNKDPLSNCRTVSQFLGSVIETAYEQENINCPPRTLGKRDLKNSSAMVAQAQDKRKNEDVREKDGINRSMYQYKKHDNYNRNYSKISSSASLGVSDSSSVEKCSKNNQVRALLENDKELQTKMRSSYQSANISPVDLRNERFHKQLESVHSKEAECSLLYGKPLERDSSPHTDGSFSTARHSLTDLLVTKLIKGDIPDVIKVATDSLPVHGNKKQSCSQREHPRAQSADTSKNKEITSENEKDTQNINDDNLIGEGNKRKANQPKNQQEDRAVTICPIKTAPTRLAIEGNLHGLGLHSIQAPVAFCSNLQDLPDRPMEHGGRVLKVESRRICELSPFATSQHIIGIWEWRKKSVASSKLLASQSIGKALLERLQQEAQLRLMMAGDHKVILTPIHCPPSHASVVKWLRKNMATVKEEKLKQELKSAPTFSNSLVDDLQLEERQKSDILSYNPDDSFLKDANQSSDSLQKNTCEIHSVKKSGENDSSISKADHSISNSLDDSSTLIDTDLELSCMTPTETPAPIVSPAEALTLSNPSAVTSPQDSHATPPSDGQVIQRKRKLKFEDNGSQSSSQENSISNPNTLDEHFRKTKRRLVNFRNLNNKIELLVTTMSSTPVRRTSNDLFDPTCTPISSPQDVQDGSKQMIPTLGSEQVEKPAKKSQSTDKPTPVIKPVSTSTENLLKDNVLTSQTQRKFSNLGLTTAEVSQIEGPTPKNTFGFKVPQTHVQDAKALHKYQYVTTLSVELHIETRGDLKPDPEFDAIQAVFYSVLDDIPADQGRRNITGVILVDKDSWSNIAHRLESDTTSKDKSLSPGKISMLSAHPSELPSTSTFPHTSDNPTIPCRSQVPMCNPNLEKIKGEQHPSTSPSLQSVSKPERGQALLEKCAVDDLEVTYVQDEMDIINTFTQLVSSFDPDILVGYEIQMLSWGYLLQRAAHLNVDLCSKIARVQDSKENNHFTSEKDEWGADHMSEIHVAGRIVLNLWRILRHEAALNVYSFENVAFHVLHRRIPLYSFRTLTKWYNNRTFLQRWRVFEHYTARVKGQLEIIDQLDLIGKTSEFARVFGIEFYDVLARGSQIRVESMMLRIAKPLNYVAVSPGVNQRARQRAPECIQLNLEPESKYYTSPVVVLDFQSLYPSIMIAYNYCFSTCLGRLDFLENAHEGPFEFGCTTLNVKPGTLKKIKEHVTVSPNGVAFLNSSVRKGVLPTMVEEILNTRLMVKKSMKAYKNDKILTRMLDARQLGLKLIANVTYGYTGASYSGRMPCIEVGDSIVRKARESLERAIELVRNTPKWGASVVYGDTDSMFIHLPGRSKEEAFKIGHEIADAVTAMFPKPMKLRFEKVYLPCVLQTKKRYVGFMYESADQKEPTFDAKGIETVRRDSCSAVSKILERSIKVLFSTHDLSRVRAYVTRQLHKLLEGKVGLLDLIFAKEFRGTMGYKPGACVPALEIARKRLRIDRRSEPRVGERVPYVIIHGSPGLPLIQLVREPWELVTDTTLRLNANYYITKQILPPLDRLFALIGINVFKWYSVMPKVVRVGHLMGTAQSTAKQGTISQFFATTNCPVCEIQTKKSICDNCRKDPQLVVWTLTAKIHDWDRTYNKLTQVCHTCQGIQEGEQNCVSLDCPILFRRNLAKMELSRSDNLQQTLNKYLQF